MSSLSRKIARILLSAIVGFWIAFVAGNLSSVVSSALGVVMGLGLWIGMTYLLYRYYHPRILIGSALLAGAVLCLLLPPFLFIYGATRGGALMGVISLGVSVLLAIVLAPVGLVLAYFGYRLTTEGISKVKHEEVQAPQIAIPVQPTAASGAVFCRFCGTRIAPEHVYCAVCGQKQPTQM